MPKEIHVTRTETFVYNVQDIVDMWVENAETETEEDIMLEDVLETIRDYVAEDFANFKNAAYRLENEDGEYIGKLYD